MFNKTQLKVLDILGIKIGDKIKVDGWFTYEVTSMGFVISKGEYDHTPKTDCFDIILERGFEIIE